MEVRSKHRYIIYLGISFVLHISAVSFVDPTIEKKGVPIFVSWLDILSRKDLSFVSLPERKGYKPLTASLLGNQHFLSYYFKNKRLFLPQKRTVFVEKAQMLTKKTLPAPIFLKKEQAPFIELLEIKCRTLNYNVAVTKDGRIGFISPLVLPLNSAANLYVDEYLRDTAPFLAKNKFYWTKVRVVIK